MWSWVCRSGPGELPCLHARELRASVFTFPRRPDLGRVRAMHPWKYGAGIRFQERCAQGIPPLPCAGLPSLWLPFPKGPRQSQGSHGDVGPYLPSAFPPVLSTFHISSYSSTLSPLTFFTHPPLEPGGRDFLTPASWWEEKDRVCPEHHTRPWGRRAPIARFLEPPVFWGSLSGRWAHPSSAPTLLPVHHSGWLSRVQECRLRSGPKALLGKQVRGWQEILQTLEM